jgi:ATPase family AAA domain-containing protein 2
MTTIEAHQGQNGPNNVIDITDHHATQPAEGSSGLTNGIIMEQQQTMQQLPPLYDMDLERMQADLFKGRYLTPQDFLDDVGKMVHNADARSHEDLDRLYRAQAMFTATQVSIQEFDPQLRLECERMAVRERQRREQHKKSKGKEKAQDNQLNGGAAVGARRSARNNGQQPELSITDPVKLERRLKRQRGEECSGGDSHGSEEELNGAGEEGRDAKRTRIIDDDDDHDPLDILGAIPSSAVRSHVVRFATNNIEPMAPLTALPPRHTQSPMPVNRNNTPAPSAAYNNTQARAPANFGNTPGLFYGNDSAPSGSYGSIPAPPANYHNDLPGFHPDQMAVDDSSSRPSGFDPSLLNPMPPAQAPFHPSPFTSRPNDSSFNFPMMSIDPSDPFTAHTTQGQPMSFTQMLAKTPTPPPLHLALPQPSPSHRTPTFRIRTPEPERVLTPTPAPVLEPMIIEVERSPSPPLPDFHVDIGLIGDLRQTLRDSTASLTIEQLEQLRATCLGNLWRHRSDWDRDNLVRELQGVVKVFVEEISANCDSEDE